MKNKIKDIIYNSTYWIKDNKKEFVIISVILVLLAFSSIFYFVAKADTRTIVKITLDTKTGNGLNTIYYVKEEDALFSNENCSTAMPGNRISLPTKEGNKFKGYISNDSSKNLIIDENGYVTDYFRNIVNSGVHLINGLKATWGESIGKITLDIEDGNGISTFYYWREQGKFYKDSNCKEELANISAPTQSGYNFKGYTNNNGLMIDENGQFMDLLKNALQATLNLPLKAKWEKIIKSIGTITLDTADKNGISTFYYWREQGKFYKDSNCTEELANISAPTQSGYNFKGYTYSESNNLMIDENGQFTQEIRNALSGATLNMSLKVKWEKIVRSIGTITLDTASKDGISKIYYLKTTSKFYKDEAHTQEITKITPPTKSNCTFNGYNESGTTNLMIDTAGNFTSTLKYAIGYGDLELSAQWNCSSGSEGQSYKTITLDTASKDGINKIYYLKTTSKFYKDVSHTQEITKITPPIKSNCTFNGYNESGTTNLMIDTAGNFTSTLKYAIGYGDLELNAQWDCSSGSEGQSYKTITLNPADKNGISKIYLSKATEKFYKDEACTQEITKITPPTKDGHIFDHYKADIPGVESNVIFIDSNGTLTDNLKTLKTYPTDFSLSAEWKDNSEVTGFSSGEIVFDTTTGDNISKIYYPIVNGVKQSSFYSTSDCKGSSITKITPPIKDGYTFDGYYISNSTSNYRFIDKDGNIDGSIIGYMNAKSVTVTAKWNSNSSGDDNTGSDDSNNTSGDNSDSNGSDNSSGSSGSSDGVSGNLNDTSNNTSSVTPQTGDNIILYYIGLVLGIVSLIITLILNKSLKGRLKNE